VLLRIVGAQAAAGKTMSPISAIPWWNDAMDRIQGLQLFVRVCETGSLTRAAVDLGVTQPTATKHIAQLEKRLGARLFHRSTRGVTPTEVGAAYYDQCKAITLQLDAADNLAALMQSRVQGALRINSSVAFGRRVLVPMVLRYMQQHPGVTVDLGFEDRYVNLVEQGIDLALRMGRLADSSLGARYLGTNPWALVAAPAYLAEAGTPKRPDDLARHRALIYSTVQGDERWHFAGPDGRSTSVAVKGPLRSNNLSALLAAARAGMGVAALPLYVAQASLARDELVLLLERHTLPAQPIHAVYPSPRQVPAKVVSFVNWLQGQFDDGWWGR
jgi:DNA-binding transcriptional LysR family regulator